MKASRLTVPGAPGRGNTSSSARSTEESSSIDCSHRMSKSSATTSNRRQRYSRPSRSSHSCRSKNPSPLYTIGFDNDSCLDDPSYTDAQPSNSATEVLLPGNVSSRMCWGIETNTVAQLPLLFSDSSCISSQTGESWSKSSSRFRDERCERSRSFWEEDSLRAHSEKELLHRRSLSNLWGFFRPEAKVLESSCQHLILVSVHILGSPGDLNFMVNKTDSVLQTIDLALSRYAAQGRQPALSSTPSHYGLYCHDPDFQALDTDARIGDRQTRHFHLYQNQEETPLLRGDSALSCNSRDGKITSPIKNWILDCVDGMRSCATKLIAGFSHALLGFWVTCLNPWKFESIVYASADLLRSIK